MDGKLYIDKDEIQTASIKAPECYEIDVDKIDSVVDFLTIFQAMYKGKLFICNDSPYYEDLKHLKKDEE